MQNLGTHFQPFVWGRFHSLAARFIVALIAIIVLAGLAIPATTAQHLSFSGCSTGELVPVVNDAFEQQIVDLTNAYREQNGLSPLTRVVQLDNAARYHAADMAQDDYTAHPSNDRVDGELVEQCSTFERVAAYYNAQLTAENIAWSFSSPQDVVDAWIGSPSHRENLLREGVTEIGVGYYEGGSQGTYWVQVLGNPGGPHPEPVEETPVNETPSGDNLVYLPLIGR